MPFNSIKVDSKCVSMTTTLRALSARPCLMVQMGRGRVRGASSGGAGGAGGVGAGGAVPPGGVAGGAGARSGGAEVAGVTGAEGATLPGLHAATESVVHPW
jgi:hypothetical protein